MTLRDEVDKMIDHLYDKYEVRGEKPGFVNGVGEGVEILFDTIVQDEAVIRETQWEVLQETNTSVSWDEVVAVLEALNRVLKGGETEDGGKSNGHTDGQEARS